MVDRIGFVRRWVQYRWRRVRRLPWTVLGILVAMATASSLAGLWGTEEGLKGLWLNLGTELVGAVVTYVLLDLVLETRQRKEALIGQMGSAVRDVAVAAVEELRREGWLTDGSLRGRFFWGAQLENANLLGANLREADLYCASFRETMLTHANLERANLLGANLQDAHLVSANLDGARILVEQLAQAKSLKGTVLPEGTELSADNWQAEFEEWRKKQKEQVALSDTGCTPPESTPGV